MPTIKKYKLFLLWLVVFYSHPILFAQLRVTIPSGAGLTIDFGHGTTNPGPPLSEGYTGFMYSSVGCPAAGHYTVVNSNNCGAAVTSGAGHLFFGDYPIATDSDYMMVADYEASATSATVFRDTVRNLCGSTSYVFWAAILNLGSSCFYPNFTFSAQTTSGMLIKSYGTGDIGDPSDHHSGYFGYKDADIKAPFPYYYGLSFTLPAGVSDVVLSITTNPSNVVRCEATFAMDNIQLSALGPDISIANNSGGWITGSCFQGNLPVVLSGSITGGYYDFNTFRFVDTSFINPAVQWQQSLDDGYTWRDIPGETNLNLSKVFSTPDTFFLRLRGSDGANIRNSACSVVSNVVQVQVDGVPTGYNIGSNSPVCTDSDVVFTFTGGGAGFTVTGPNGFYDNSPHPHVYHPSPSDSGWYRAQISTFGGCAVEDSIFVKVIGPNLSVSASPLFICYGSSTRLAAGGGTSYAWSPAVSLSNARVPSPVASPLTTTTYHVKATDGTGCSAYDSITIILRDSALKAVINGPGVLCPADAAVFTDTSVGAIVSWYWDFGNGITRRQRQPLPFSYPPLSRNATYLVQLTVTDTAGCLDTALKYVQSVTNCYIRVPAAFTPNGDGRNDDLYPLNAYKATTLSFTVYNRFGMPVFATSDWTHKWDGISNGMPQPAGTYVWLLTYTDADGKRVSLRGTSVLLR